MPSTQTEGRRWPALYLLWVGVLMFVLDVTVASVALPSIQTDLGLSLSGLAWVVSAYLIAFGGLALTLAREQARSGAGEGRPVGGRGSAEAR